ncbi:MAG: CehA/McbA family metallohydrolase [Puniceicoccaceae bacterium]
MKLSFKHIPLLAVLLLAGTQHLSAHGLGGDLHEWDMDEAKLKEATLVSGMDAIARELLQHGTYNFSATDLRLLQKSHDFYTAAQQPSAIDLDRTHALNAAGDVMLKRFLHETDFAVEVDIHGDHIHMDWDKVHKLPREDGFVLLHVASHGNGEEKAFTLEKNLETHQEHNDELQIPFVSDGESWILIRFLRPALENAIVQFVFQGTDNPEKRIPCFLNVVSEKTGTLDFSVLDENNQPTPAMVELRSVRTNHIYRPATAVEFSDQMDHIAGTPVKHHSRPDAGQGVPYIASIPGDSWGMYYCVDRPFNMALPVGTWSVKIWKGLEYEPVHKVITVKEGKETKLDLKLKRWIDMGQQGWYSGDDHIHSRLMSDADADHLFTFMEATDLDLGNILLMGNNLRTFYPQRGFGPEFRVENNGRFLIPGQEDPRYFNGHAIGLNITSLVRDMDKYLYNDWVAQTIKDQGGLYGFAHMIYNTFNIIRDLAFLMPKGLGDFGEIHQSGLLETELYYDFLNLGFDLSAAGGSDVPYSHMMGEVRIYCYTGESKLTADAWFDALRDGHCFVTNGPILELTLDGAIPGDEIRVDENRVLKAQAIAKGPTGKGSPRRIELIWHGEVIASKESNDTSKTELSIELDVPAGFGGWLAVRSYSHDGQAAHSTPVYVTRNGYKRWDPEKAPAVIDKCLATIEGYRNELLRIRDMDNNGAFPPTQIYGNQLAAMVPGGLERADEAENYYIQLKAELAKEVEKRQRSLGK